MAEELLMPKLGATMEKGTIIGWLKNEGDQVETGEPILEIMTDKINMEVEATSSGILLKKLYDQEEEVPVLVPIAYIGHAGETYGSQPNKDIEKLLPETKNGQEQEASDEPKIPQTSLVHSKPRRTPAALRLANKHEVDLTMVKGSGPNNRIHLMDVEQFINQNAKKMTPLAKKIAEDNDVDTGNLQTASANAKIGKVDVLRELPTKRSRSVNYNGIRKVVGERMSKSASVAPHVTLHTEADMTKAIEVRNLLLEKIKSKTGLRLSFTEIIVKSTAYALKAHPMVNASLNGNQIDIHTDINIGLAVAVPNGLVVPVIRNADEKGLAALTEESKKLAKNARENKLNSDDMSGGTFTISNLGMYAVDSFTPIINQPESAILGVGRIKEQVVSNNGSIEVRPQMSLSLSFDHRVIDGAPAAHFLTDLKEILENPYELMV
ncbi:dihydrolipoamide acetyltransferase family protein [Peribacillus glennii]|uniref:Dihydrolipoamide acetyltransferase component of pyruvate dehydrogenase complex n=1 Tax=Peribacillus glennii TaxID=2303991 RepID=A0A372LES0_9BACI|nr:dihydrolipoamide acetyltransferase family protein [Peribacillus glennii]RFU64813.1 2-oxo acid dehydrogenase subunit E2 [Peribacillus glennii]